MTVDETPLRLPQYKAEQFALENPPECDMVMKGGITSGIVYPYAILEIATKYRFRSLGGTSAGAIAAAFAAAAEYGRRSGNKDSFILLKHYSDQLPDKLLSLFQPSPEFLPAIDVIKTVMKAKGIKPLVDRAIQNAILPALAGAALLAIPSALLGGGSYATVLAALLGLITGGLIGGIWRTYRWGRTTLAQPLLDAWNQISSHNFGICTGTTQEGHNGPGLTNWIHEALQHIAFGDPKHSKPLTFGDLKDAPDGSVPINLQVVTTNLSMRRPHTLPRLNMAAAFFPAQWNRLFPGAVMQYLTQDGGTRPFKGYSGSWLFPREQNLPVIVAVRMSLSFPVLFEAVPLLIKDRELPSIIEKLGGKPETTFRTVHFSDGGISSNFPIHMFDSWLPTRPTFAFSLDDLMLEQEAADSLASRVILPTDAAQGMGVPALEIQKLTEFGWQILNSAKDWQDQLMSELSGQRERIARIYLTSKEGGLNLNMSRDTSLKLMFWGYEAGRKFVDGEFSFDEHKWRRLLVLYRHIEENLAAMDKVWDDDFAGWYASYAPKAESYRLSLLDQKRLAEHVNALLAARDIRDSDVRGLNRFPKRAGKLKITPNF